MLRPEAHELAVDLDPAVQPLYGFLPAFSASCDLNSLRPVEIGQLAEALNEMRLRIRRLVDERTRMLASGVHRKVASEPLGISKIGIR